MRLKCLIKAYTYVDITELGKNILMRNEASIEDTPKNIVHS